MLRPRHETLDYFSIPVPVLIYAAFGDPTSCNARESTRVGHLDRVIGFGRCAHVLVR